MFIESPGNRAVIRNQCGFRTELRLEAGPAAHPARPADQFRPARRAKDPHLFQDNHTSESACAPRRQGSAGRPVARAIGLDAGSAHAHNGHLSDDAGITTRPNAHRRRVRRLRTGSSPARSPEPCRRRRSCAGSAASGHPRRPRVRATTAHRRPRNAWLAPETDTFRSRRSTAAVSSATAPGSDPLAVRSSMVKAGPPKRPMVIAAVGAGGSRRTTLAGAGAECGHYLGHRGDGLVAEHGEDRIGGHRSAKGQTGPVQFTRELCTEYLTATRPSL